MKTLIIDNDDSFTFNLVHLFGEVTGEEPLVVQSHERPWEELAALDPDAIVISPGPGRPEREADFGVCLRAIREARAAVLGVCLGHQGIGHAFGGRVTLAPEPMHGRVSLIHHEGARMFQGIPSPFSVVRYHSLVVDPRLPACLSPTAWTRDGVLMALEHRDLPRWGVQFHPESICSEHGRALVRNFRDFAWSPRGGRTGAKRAWAETARKAAEPRGGGYAVHHRKLAAYPDAERLHHAFCAGQPASFWLDASRAGEGLARFSFMGASGGPHAMVVSYRSRGRRLTITDRDGTREQRESILSFLRRELARRRVESPELPFDFNSGFVGYLGYELKAECGGDDAHESPLPDAQLLLADRLVVLDHHERSTYLVCLAGKDDAHEAMAWLEEAGARVREAERAKPAPPMDAPTPARAHYRLARDRDTYLDDIARCKELIRQGESYEICLTNQLVAETSPDPVLLYRALRRLNPAPYAALLCFGDNAIACSSPERFLRVTRDGWVESKPIKGTRPRGQTREEDEALAHDLAHSEKDRAENLMIVDLVRHDLGRVCALGSVHVPQLMEVESYATVHHLVSTIRGRLREGASAVDAVQAAFPGGSMTGAPKIRTMQILDAIEGRARGVYAGSIGYLALSGAADLNIVIRTAVITKGRVTVGTGGAIVALSDAESELAEVELKARAVARAFRLEDGDAAPS